MEEDKMRIVEPTALDIAYETLNVNKQIVIALNRIAEALERQNSYHGSRGPG